MKVWQLAYPHNLQHVSAPDLKLTDDKVKVKVTKALITESDVAVYSGAIKVTAPFIPGRFAIGQITEAGEDSFVKKGERVYLAGVTEDECAPDGLRIAGETVDGFYRDFVLAGIDDVYPLPASVTDEAAFLIDAIALAEHVVDELHVGVGQHVLVLGGGLYGNILCQILIYHRAVPILADNNAERLSRAKKSGIYYTFP
ncbi:MAG: alcohol dehydrogenase catalytic domain-containing protein, partial [Clostridia bacterium]|nr:alcohol dehydrogenase catalytic domain-containing protein [Clostridia bacterium]